MINYTPALPLISIHIPKTGGTSFRRNLEAWFGSRLHFHYRNVQTGVPPAQVRLTRRWLPGYRRRLCIHGHFNRERGVGIETYYPDVRQFITWLREPDALHRSLFAHHLAHQGHATYWRDSAWHHTNDVDEFYECARCPYFKSFPRPVTPDNLFEQIAAWFIHIGVLEHPVSSMRILAGKLNQHVADLPKENTRTYNNTPSPSAGAVQRFKEQHALEYQCYEFALRLNA